MSFFRVLRIAHLRSSHWSHTFARLDTIQRHAVRLSSPRAIIRASPNCFHRCTTSGAGPIRHFSSSHTRLTFSQARPPAVPNTRWHTLRREGSSCAAAIMAARSASVTWGASRRSGRSSGGSGGIVRVCGSTSSASERPEAPPSASRHCRRSPSSISEVRTLTASRPATTQKTPAPPGGPGSAEGGTAHRRKLKHLSY